MPGSSHPDAGFTTGTGGEIGLAAVAARDELLAMIKANAIVHGEVILASGMRADWYIDLRRVLLDGRAAPLAGRVMLEATADLSYEAVGGCHDARRERSGPVAGRLRGAQGRKGARPAAPDRRTGCRGPPGPRRGGD